MKKRAALLLVAILTLASFTGCGGKTEETTQPVEISEAGKQETEAGTTSEADAADSGASADGEKAELTICTVSKPFIEDLETNDFTRYLEEQTGIHINWITVPLNNKDEKAQLILASGDLPDVFMSLGFTTAQLTKYGIDEGLFIPLDEYIESDAPNLQKALAEYPKDNALDTIRLSDGKVYSMPLLDVSEHSEHAAKMWLYDPWMQELGLEYPTTTEEFEEVLRAFKTQDPNGNGIADEIPLIAQTNGWYGQFDDFLLNAFVYYDSVNRGMYMEDGKVVNCLTQEGYKKGLQWLNKLYSEGLIYENSMTQKKDASKTLSGGEVPLVGATPGGSTTIAMTGERAWQIRPVEPLEGPDGVKQSPTFASMVQNGQYVITSACENVEAAVRLADFMYQDVPSLWTRVGGPEGDFWEKAKEGDVGYNGEPAKITILKPWKNTEPQNVSWIDLGVWNYTNMRVDQTVPEDLNMWSEEGNAYMLHRVTKELYEPYAVDKQMPQLAISTEEAERTAQLCTDLDKLMDSSQFNFITGAYNFESDWDKYVQEANNLIEPLAEIYQTAYDRIYTK